MPSRTHIVPIRFRTQTADGKSAPLVPAARSADVCRPRRLGLVAAAWLWPVLILLAMSSQAAERPNVLLIVSERNYEQWNLDTAFLESLNILRGRDYANL